jgi:sugar fermentation stimulation protein A
MREVVVRALPMTRVATKPIRARFLERPNRFKVVAELEDGSVVGAHCPNPGRLTGTISPRCEVLLDGPFPPPRQLAYTMVAAREARTWVGTLTTYANQLFPVLWKEGLFPELSGRRLASEVRHDRSRFDFRLDKTFIEVKSVTMRQGRLALFPDAVTARGARHCRELAEISKSGIPAAIVLVGQRGDVDTIRPAVEIDPGFAAALRDAADAGVTVLGCAAQMTIWGARRVRRVKVEIPAVAPVAV